MYVNTRTKPKVLVKILCVCVLNANTIPNERPEHVMHETITINLGLKQRGKLIVTNFEIKNFKKIN